MSSKANPKAPSVNQPPAYHPDKKKVKIRKQGRWVEVDVDSVVQKGKFRYIKFTDEDGLETYWISPE
jgi:uncharacterized membrane protein